MDCDKLLTSHTIKQYPDDTKKKDTGDDPECRNDNDDDENNDDDDSVRLTYKAVDVALDAALRDVDE